MHGKGLFTWKNKDKYEGDYKYDVKHGQGKFIWADGSSISGQFINGEMYIILFKIQ